MTLRYDTLRFGADLPTLHARQIRSIHVEGLLPSYSSCASCSPPPSQSTNALMYCNIIRPEPRSIARSPASRPCGASREVIRSNQVLICSPGREVEAAETRTYSKKETEPELSASAVVIQLSRAVSSMGVRERRTSMSRISRMATSPSSLACEQKQVRNGM